MSPGGWHNLRLSATATNSVYTHTHTHKKPETEKTVYLPLLQNITLKSEHQNQQAIINSSNLLKENVRRYINYLLK